MERPEVLWMEDEPISEWEPVGDRWTNVRDGRERLVFGSHVFSYDPSESPLLKILAGRSSSIVIRPATRRERLVRWWRRLRLALAEWIDPYSRHDDDEDPWP